MERWPSGLRRSLGHRLKAGSRHRREKAYIVNMFYVYVIQSIPKGRYYIGSTKKVDARLKSHNSGANRSTKPYRPWRIVHTEELPDKTSALIRELQIKSYKGGRAFKALIQSS